jgi:hypothetical protein
MATKLQSCMKGPQEWPEITIPDWYRERAEALIAKLGEDHPDSKAFKNILTVGHVEEKAVDYLEFITANTKDEDSIQLAIDLSQHCFTTIKMMTLIPLRMH